MKLLNSRVLKLVLLNLVCLSPLVQASSILLNQKISGAELADVKLVPGSKISIQLPETSQTNINSDIPKNLVSPQITAINSTEIQAESVVLAGNINRDWWIKAGAYAATAATAGYYLYGKREAIKTTYQDWRYGQKLVTDLNLDHVKPLESAKDLSPAQKATLEKTVQTLAAVPALAHARLQQELTEKIGQEFADKTSWGTQIKNGFKNFVGTAIWGVVPALVMSSAMTPAAKFMGARNLNYYLYKTDFEEQVTQLENFIGEIGDQQELEDGTTLDLTADIQLQLASLRVAMVTVLAYMEYAQNDLATGIEADIATAVNQKIQVLKGITFATQQNCNSLLDTVQAALGHLKTKAERKAEADKLVKIHRALIGQFNLFRRKLAASII